MSFLIIFLANKVLVMSNELVVLDMRTQVDLECCCVNIYKKIKTTSRIHFNQTRFCQG